MALLTILDYATAVAVGAATSQQANLEALLAPFGAGPVTARLEGPTGTHLRALTISLPTIEATTPRRFTLAAHLADAAVATGAPGRWVFRTSGGLSVFSIPAGTGGSSINHVGDVKTLCTPTLQGVVVTAPSGLPSTSVPTWRAGRAALEWGQIAGTAPSTSLSSMGFSERACDAYNCLVVDSLGNAYGVAWGGHDDGSSNGAAKIGLMANTPAWSVLFSGTASPTPPPAPPALAVPYYADGRPTSRHGYAYLFPVEGGSAVLLAGCKFGWSGGSGNIPAGPGMDVFDLVSNDYRPRFHYPDIPDGSFGTVQDAAGNIWTQTGYKFTVATKTWSRPSSGTGLRFPAATDQGTDRSLWLQFGDSQGFDASLGIQAKELNHADGSIRTITIAPSAARTAFEAAQPAYPSMDFCPVDGKYWFFHAGEPQVAYKVTPSSVSTSWVMERVVFGGLTPVTTNSSSAAVPLMQRVRWVQPLGGFVGIWAARTNLYFLPVT
jgi:hypothetical protein